MKIGSQIVAGFAPLVDLVYPPRCPVCGGGVAKHGGLCSACWSELVIPGEPACVSCGRPFGPTAAIEGAICAPCLAKPPKHSGIAAATLYNEVSRKLVLAFKHGAKIGLAPMLAQLIAARLPPLEEGREMPLLVPVPLHRWRLWRRGYNQAALLAQELARLGRGVLVVDALVRSKPTPTLGGLGQRQREKASRGAIEIAPARKMMLGGRDVILVDDVLTSGATSRACVAALLKAGAATVRIACFARVLDDGLGFDNKRTTNETPEIQKTSGAT